MAAAVFAARLSPSIGCSQKCEKESSDKSSGVGKGSAAWAIQADEIGLAETAHSVTAILFSARPEVAPRKAAKYGGAPRVRTFALQSEEDFLHRIFAHGPRPD